MVWYRYYYLKHDSGPMVLHLLERKVFVPLLSGVFILQCMDQLNKQQNQQTIMQPICIKSWLIGSNYNLQQIQQQFMRKLKTYVLEEEEHLQNLRKIIKRDFFSTQVSDSTQRQSQAIPLRLNDYIRNFKSNENQIFTELVRGDAEDWKKKHEWMEKSKQLMLGPGSQHKPYTNMIAKDPTLKAIDYSVIKQNSKNAVFFNHDGETKSYNSAEHDKLKKVAYDNCHIETSQIEKAKVYERRELINPNLQQIPATPILAGRYESKAKKTEYSIKRIPSPEPEKLPIMTWGEIESTPFRIQSNCEPDYRIPQKSTRDQLLDELTSKLTKQKMIKKAKKQEFKTKILSSMRAVASSYRKQSIARENSEKRELKRQDTGSKLDNLIKNKK